ncbi:MAG TPA: LysR family transcriptional regulator [Thermoleophilaceae bacterium]|nr:LysR family transcriptional regulator [Thermoleophilaceae bacterium]
MTLRQLEYLLAVAEAGSFTSAAAKLHVSQPSLSHQIKVLEQEVGVRLLDRPPKPVRLTRAGRSFVSEARVSVASAQRAIAAARQAAQLEPEEISVATVQSLSVSALPECLQRWHTAEPAIVIKLSEFTHRSDVERAVTERAAELGVGPAPREWRGAYERLGWDELVAVLPTGDPLLQSPRPVRLEMLAGASWVLFHESHGLAENVRRACADAGFDPRPLVRTTQVEAAAKLAASGVGPALVPMRNVPPVNRQLVRRLDPPVVWELAVFADAPRFSSPGRAFVDALLNGDWQRTRSPGALVLDPD